MKRLRRHWVDLHDYLRGPDGKWIEGVTPPKDWTANNLDLPTFDPLGNEPGVGSGTSYAVTFIDVALCRTPGLHGMKTWNCEESSVKMLNGREQHSSTFFFSSSHLSYAAYAIITPSCVPRFRQLSGQPLLPTIKGQGLHDERRESYHANASFIVVP